MKKMIKEFKTFISRGNVIDLAVGVVVGNAFTKIVNSLVDNIIMPLVGILIGGVDFTKLSLTIFGVNIQFGVFIQNVVDFLIIAFCIFMVIKLINKLTHKKEEKKDVKPPVKSDEVKLLEEIRDLMKKDTNKKTTKNK